MNSNLHRWTELDIEKRQLEARLEEVKAELKSLNEPIMTYFAENGIDRITVNGRTVYQKRTIRASCGGEVDIVAEELTRIGKGELVKQAVNANTLSAFVREFDEGNMSAEEIAARLPGNLGNLINITEMFEITARKAQ